MLKFIPNHAHAWLTELKNFLDLSRNETYLSADRKIFLCGQLKILILNLETPGTENFMTTWMEGPDCQIVRLYQYFYRQISVTPTLSLTGKVELRNKKWNRILILQTPCDQTELGILFTWNYLQYQVFTLILNHLLTKHDLGVPQEVPFCSDLAL